MLYLSLCFVTLHYEANAKDFLACEQALCLGKKNSCLGNRLRISPQKRLGAH